MAKKAQDKSLVSKLNALAKTVADTLGIREAGADLVLQICNAVTDVFGGDPIDSKDLDYMADEVVRLRGWRANSIKTRRSETVAILKAYDRLPDAIERSRSHKTKGKPVPFSDAVKLARLLNGNKTPTQAAAAFLNNKTSKASDPKTRSKADAQKSIKGHVKRILQFTQAVPKKHRAELIAWAMEIGVEL